MMSNVPTEIQIILDANDREALYTRRCRGLVDTLMIRANIGPISPRIAGSLGVAFELNNTAALMVWVRSKEIDFDQLDSEGLVLLYKRLIDELSGENYLAGI